MVIIGKTALRLKKRKKLFVVLDCDFIYRVWARTEAEFCKKVEICIDATIAQKKVFIIDNTATK